MATEELNTAIALARRHHRGIKDRSGREDYIAHPMRVMAAVSPFGDEYKIVAVLHDVMEDKDINGRRMARASLSEWGFSQGIMEALTAITRKQISGRTMETYQEYIERVAKDPIARVVKIADLRDNLRRITWLPSRECRNLRKRYLKSLSYLGASEHDTFFEADYDWKEMDHGTDRPGTDATVTQALSGFRFPRTSIAV